MLLSLSKCTVVVAMRGVLRKVIWPLFKAILYDWKIGWTEGRTAALVTSVGILLDFVLIFKAFGNN